MDMVRPGLLLYGCGEFASELGLRPAMTLKAMINTIKIYDEGTDISYGRLFRTTSSPTRIGVIPYGYADGFFRCLSNRCSIMTAAGPAPAARQDLHGHEHDRLKRAARMSASATRSRSSARITRSRRSRSSPEPFRMS